MEIDIIDLTDPEYADLSPVQLSMVRVAQAKKNNILAKMDEELRELFNIMHGNWNARADAYSREERNYIVNADLQIQAVQEDLLYQLAYETLANEGNENGPYRYPENPNYNLSVSQRFLVVRQYYMEATDDPEARLRAYAMDTLAREYLGEFYQTLYDLLANYC